jgi:hypothetical protein
MIDALYQLYNFITNIRTMFDVIVAMGVVFVPIAVTEKLSKNSSNKLVVWSAPILCLLALLGASAGLYQLIGYPSWMGWLI